MRVLGLDDLPACESNRERAAVAKHTFHSDGAAHHLDQSPADRQTQADTARCVIAGLEELLEQSGEILGCDALARVNDTDRNDVAIAARRNGDSASWLRVVDRI